MLLGTEIGVKAEGLHASTDVRRRGIQVLLKQHGYTGYIRAATDGASRQHAVPILARL